MDSANVKPEAAGIATLRPKIKHRARARDGPAIATVSLSPLPIWLETALGANRATFAAGAALFALDQLIRAAPPWLAAWRMRQALRATVSAGRILRIGADEASLRDALHLTRAGDDPGPAGRLHALIRRLAQRPRQQGGDGLAALSAEIGRGDAAAEITALLAADLALAEQLSWPEMLPLFLTAILDPLLRQGQGGRRPRASEPSWPERRDAVLTRAALRAHAEAVTLDRRAGPLLTTADGLRSRGRERGVALILADDCVAPWQMAGRHGLGSDRAARRFCESLQAAGALRLLTRRPSFRLYGL